MKKKLFQACIFLTLFGVLLITPLGRVSAQTEWNLQVSNLSNNTVTYSYAQLLAMPETTVTAGEYCYGSPVTSGDWTGVSLSYLLQKAGLDPTVASVYFIAADGYTVSLQIQDALRSDVIIAYQLNNVSLPETLRLVLPEENGNMWIAMITSVSMSTYATQPAIGGGPGIGLGITIPGETIVSSNLTTPTPTMTLTPTLSPVSPPSASPNRGQLWNYTTENSVESSPSVVGGAVYVGSGDGKVYALNAVSGTLIWNFTTGGYVFSSPTVVRGVVYIGSYDGKVYALNATNGNKLWNYPTGGHVVSSPAVVNGVVYIGSYDGKVYALNAASGAKIWSFSTRDYVRSSPSVVGGVVYVGSGDGKVYAIGARSIANSGVPTIYIIVTVAVIIIVIAALALALGRRKINPQP